MLLCSDSLSRPPAGRGILKLRLAHLVAKLFIARIRLGPDAGLGQPVKDEGGVGVCVGHASILAWTGVSHVGNARRCVR